MIPMIPSTVGNPTQDQSRPDPFLDPDWLHRPPWRTLIVTIGILFIILWQGFLAGQTRDPFYTNHAASGIGQHYRFVYFLHYLNLFPITTPTPPITHAREEALRILREEGETLLTEYNHTVRWGDHGRTYLFLLDTHLKGSAFAPSLLPANAAIFILALIGLFLAFYHARLTLPGLILVLLMGSNPFQLYAIYDQEKIFGWMISTALLLLALLLPFMGGKPPRPLRAILLVSLSGFILAASAQVRPDVNVLAFSVLGVLLTQHRRPWRARMALALIFLAVFSATNLGFKSFFDLKYQEAAQTVRSAGGIPFTGNLNKQHNVWHALYAGLGDFDYTYGHKWNDRHVLRQVWPHFQARLGTPLPPWDHSQFYPELPDWSEGGGRYFNSPYTYPEYFLAVRDLFLHEIGADPLWYLRILLRRGWEILNSTTPPSLDLGLWNLKFPWHGTLYLLLLALLLWKRAWFSVKLLLFPLSVSLPVWIFYAGNGMAWYSIYHLFAFAWLVLWGIHRLWGLKTTPPSP